MTNEEHLCLTELAKKADLSFSRFLVESALTGKAPTSEDRRQRERAIIQLARVGNNLNQIAKQLNAQRGVMSLSDVEDRLEGVKAALERIQEVWELRQPGGSRGPTLRN